MFDVKKTIELIVRRFAERNAKGSTNGSLFLEGISAKDGLSAVLVFGPEEFLGELTAALKHLGYHSYLEPASAHIMFSVPEGRTHRLYVKPKHQPVITYKE